jgi:hypothetical protein
MLLSLLPLTSSDTRRYLFIPTNSDWTAYFDNSHTGAVPEYSQYVALLLKTNSLRIVNDLERGDVMFDFLGKSNQALPNSPISVEGRHPIKKSFP